MGAAGTVGGSCGRPAELDIHHVDAHELNVTHHRAEMCRGRGGQSLVLSVQTSYTNDDGHIGHVACHVPRQFMHRRLPIASGYDNVPLPNLGQYACPR